MTCNILGSVTLLLTMVGLITVVFLGGAAVYIGLQMVGKGRKE